MAHAPTKDIVILNFIFPALLMRLDKLFCKGITPQFRASPKNRVKPVLNSKKRVFNTSLYISKLMFTILSLTSQTYGLIFISDSGI